MPPVEENHVTDWLPAYALGALTDDEMLQVKEHLRTCPTCQAESAHFQQLANELPLALAQSAPPPELKSRLMQSIHSRQLAQLEKPAPAAKPSTFLESLTSFFRGHLPAYGLALIIVLALGNLLLWRFGILANQQTSTPMRLVALVNTSNSSGALGTLVMDPNGKYGTLVMDNLAALDAGRQYQVWLIKGNERTSGGVFSVNTDGYASLEILAPLPLIQYDAIGISVEPAGGSSSPTGASFFHADLPK